MRSTALASRTRLTRLSCLISFFFNDTTTTEIYTLSLRDALPILRLHPARRMAPGNRRTRNTATTPRRRLDRKSTRLNSSHSQISYAVLCLKKKTLRHSELHPHMCADVAYPTPYFPPYSCLLTTCH